MRGRPPTAIKTVPEELPARIEALVAERDRLTQLLGEAEVQLKETAELKKRCAAVEQLQGFELAAGAWEPAPAI